MLFEIKPHLYTVFLALVFFCSFPMAASASTHSGEVVYSSGNVWVATPKGTKSIKNGDFVLPGDVLVTGSSGRVKLSMVDGSTVYLGSRSRMKVAAYEVRSGNLVSGIFDMLWGKARFLVAKLSLQRSDFSVRTTTAVIGVRGTQFSVQVEPPSLAVTLKPVVKLPAAIMKKRMPTNVMLFQGAIVSKNFKGVTKRIKPGQLVRFRPNGAIKVRRYKPSDVKRLGLPKLKFSEFKKRNTAVRGKVGEESIRAGNRLELRKKAKVLDKGSRSERRDRIGLKQKDSKRGGIVDQGNRIKSDRGSGPQGNRVKNRLDSKRGGIVDQGNRIKSDRGSGLQGNRVQNRLDSRRGSIVDQGNRIKSDRGSGLQGNRVQNRLNSRRGSIVDQGNRIKSDRGSGLQGNRVQNRLDSRRGSIVDQGNRIKSDRGSGLQGNRVQNRLNSRRGSIVDQGNRLGLPNQRVQQGIGSSGMKSRIPTSPAFSGSGSVPSTKKGSFVVPSTGTFTKPTFTPSRQIQRPIEGGAIGGAKVSPSRVPESTLLPGRSLKLNMNSPSGRSPASSSSLKQAGGTPGTARGGTATKLYSPLGGGVAMPTGTAAVTPKTQPSTRSFSPTGLGSIPSAAKSSLPTSFKRPVATPTISATPRISPIQTPNTSSYRLPMR